ncbi:uncharacterized protein [Rutidosis leptorrhynchoides]|uniref:uncharacterized protein n=1 Tax=Rutidosis leptorrhynchoides TaxID=125765 RepID=UPI003A991B11
MEQDRRKSYAEKRRRPKEFRVGDKVMSKVSPWKGIIRFRKRGKLGPRFIGPFVIVARVGDVAYRLLLQEELNGIHETFRVSQLQKCLAEEATYASMSEITINNKLKYFEEPIKILNVKVKQLRNKSLTLLKVQWKFRKGSECTWEPEDWLMVYCHFVYQEWFVRTPTAQQEESCHNPISA